jgi:mannose-6-phosphate isomerase-like protein (cupin superfamily)
MLDHRPLRSLASGAVLIALGALAGFAYGRDGETTRIPHGPLDSFDWVDLPEFGGREAIIYRSPDGRRVAAAFQESGKATFTYPFDEFLVVTAGLATLKVHGGETITLRKGDVAYLREGTKVDFDFSADFADITCLMADHEVKWR